MPSERPLHLIGDLREGPIFLELHVDGGGVWELDPTRQATRLVGRRVEVIGTQIGFNDLRCEEIWLAGGPRPPRLRSFLPSSLPWLWALAGLSALVLLSFV